MNVFITSRSLQEAQDQRGVEKRRYLRFEHHHFSDESEAGTAPDFGTATDTGSGTGTFTVRSTDDEG